MTPRLLVAFCSATLAMVVTVAVLLRGRHHWADFLVIGLLFAVAAALFMEQWRELGEDEQAEDDR